MTYIKLARTDGFDFYTGNTINYRENIGKTIECLNKEGVELYWSNITHASDCFFEALRHAELPCSIFIVDGETAISHSNKHGFKSFKVVKEIDTTNWKIVYYKTMKYILEDTKNNFDNMKYGYVVKAINRVIEVWNNAIKTGEIDESAARSAEYTSWLTVNSIASSIERAAELGMSSQVDSISESTVWLAVWASAWSAESAVKSTVGLVTEIAIKSALSAERAAESAKWSVNKKKKLIEYSNKFIEYLGDNQ